MIHLIFDMNDKKEKVKEKSYGWERRRNLEMFAAVYWLNKRDNEDDDLVFLLLSLSFHQRFFATSTPSVYKQSSDGEGMMGGGIQLNMSSTTC